MSPEHEMVGADIVEHGIHHGVNDGGLPLIQWDQDSSTPVGVKLLARKDISVRSSAAKTQRKEIKVQPLRNEHVATVWPTEDVRADLNFRARVVSNFRALTFLEKNVTRENLKN